MAKSGFRSWYAFIVSIQIAPGVSFDVIGDTSRTPHDKTTLSKTQSIGYERHLRTRQLYSHVV